MDVICHVCGLKLPGIQLNRHLEKFHGFQKPSNSFECSECAANFSTKFVLKRHLKNIHNICHEEEKKQFKCDKCDSSFTERKSLYRHLRTKHDQTEIDMEQQDNSKKPRSTQEIGFECYVCDKTFVSVSTLNRHKKLQHDLVLNNSGKFKCPQCSDEFATKGQLDHHVDSAHHIEPESELMSFPSLEDFFKWKNQMEIETMSHYVKHTGSKPVKNGLRSYYFCHRSGFERSKEEDEKQRINWQSTVKMGAHCTSQMTMTQCGDHVEVSFSKVHVGHEIGVKYLQLTKIQREELAARIARKENLNEILNDVRKSVTEEINQVSRLQMLERKDLLNIIRDFQLDESKADQNDAMSVHMWVEEQLKIGDEGAVIFYKPQHQLIEGSTLKKEDFMIVIMTPYQREVLSTFTEDKILIDSTHGTTEYDFQLTTLMTVDEYGAGCTVAFCISNRIDATAMIEFFTSVRQKVGVIKTDTFMSDDAPAYYNAWLVVMGPSKNRLLCTWHVDKAWKTQAPIQVQASIEKAAEVYKGCRVLLEEPDINEFGHLLDGFIKMCEEDPDTQAFAKYFKTTYAQRPEMWAHCYRIRLGLNTNMYLEAMHRKLKYIYLDGRKNRRMDKCISALLKFIRDLMFERIIRKNKNKPTKRMLSISASHKRSKKIPDTKIRALATNQWEVESSVSTRGPYVVQKLDKTCSCALRCPLCKVCVHQAICDCPDNMIRLNICKHMHACIRKVPLAEIADNHQEEEHMQREETVLTQSVANLVPVGSSISARTELDCLIMKANNLADLIEPENQKEASAGVRRLITYFESIIKKQDPSTIPQRSSTEPANKKIMTQRFKSTKKKRPVKRERRFAKPGDVQKELLRCMFIDKDVREADVVQVQSVGDLDHTY
ncbi:uncharacterized protein LOC117643114 [Thrips palmi]|uniref:Uncharacterized protein LOC117643114 n=1 Tax=Thrips palmi TaxID=161013 RepID=A0A6P8YLK3_THRPL|nr:uncharacterized protein LOC117643114 [Thrips palmi]